MTALIIATGHYFPWRDYFGPQPDGAPMPRIPSYIYGTGAIIAPLIGVYLMLGSLREAALLLINVSVAGFVTVALRALDGDRKLRRTVKETTAREKKLREQLKLYEEQARGDD